MKKLIAILLTLVMLIGLLAGCASTPAAEETPAAAETPAATEEPAAETPAAEEPAADDTKKLIYVTHGLEDMFCNWLVKCVQQQIAENYPNYSLEILDGKLSSDVQAEQLENAIAMNPDLIFYSAADGYSCTPVVQQAIDAGIPVVMLQAPTYDENDNPVCPYADCDMYEVGKMIATYAMDLIPENAQVAMLLGPAGNTHSQLRQKGWDEVLATRPDITVVDVQIGDWDTAEAMRITEDWLQQYPDLAAILSMNDSMILGAIEAAKAAGRDLLFFGVDGMADGCNAVKEGSLTATVLQDAREIAKGGLELATRCLNGEKLTGEDVLHVDAALITPENVDEFIAIHAANS